jgi:hypothetical protein
MGRIVSAAAFGYRGAPNPRSWGVVDKNTTHHPPPNGAVARLRSFIGNRKNWGLHPLGKAWANRYNSYLMRTLLRKTLTGEYYQTLSQWTKDPTEAYDFQALSPAVRFAALAHLPEMEVVLSSENGQLTAIPVTSFQHGVQVAPLGA